MRAGKRFTRTVHTAHAPPAVRPTATSHRTTRVRPPNAANEGLVRQLNAGHNAWAGEPAGCLIQQAPDAAPSRQVPAFHRVGGSHGRGSSNHCASEADGAKNRPHQPDLNQVPSYGTDAMVTVLGRHCVLRRLSTCPARQCLALPGCHHGAVQIVAPVIGPALDRLQHGRRWAMGGKHRPRGTGIHHGRALRFLLVLTRALGFVAPRRTAIRPQHPRLVLSASLVEANARLSIFGMARRSSVGAAAPSQNLWLVYDGLVVTGWHSLLRSFAFRLLHRPIYCGSEGYPRGSSSARARTQPDDATHH